MRLTILIILNFGMIVANIWAFIQLLKAKRAMEGYCKTAMESAKIAMSVQNEATDLNRRARAMFEEARKNLERSHDTTQAAGKA
jgi:hypothetical protein